MTRIFTALLLSTLCACASATAPPKSGANAGSTQSALTANAQPPVALPTVVDYDLAVVPVDNWFPVGSAPKHGKTDVIAVFGNVDAGASVAYVLDLEPAHPVLQATKELREGILAGQPAPDCSDPVPSADGLSVLFASSTPQNEGFVLAKRVSEDPPANLFFVAQWPKNAPPELRKSIDTLIAGSRITFTRVPFMPPIPKTPNS